MFSRIAGAGLVPASNRMGGALAVAVDRRIGHVAWTEAPQVCQSEFADRPMRLILLISLSVAPTDAVAVSATRTALFSAVRTTRVRTPRVTRASATEGRSTGGGKSAAGWHAERRRSILADHPEVRPLRQMSPS